MKILSFLFKPVRLIFIFRTQMKIFLIKSESFLSSIDSNATTTLTFQKVHKKIIKRIHMNFWVNYPFKRTMY